MIDGYIDLIMIDDYIYFNVLFITIALMISYFYITCPKKKIVY